MTIFITVYGYFELLIRRRFEEGDLILRRGGGESGMSRLLMRYRQIETESIDWAQLSRLLPEDGEKVQSPKRF
jgi:hypothetical protein